MSDTNDKQPAKAYTIWDVIPKFERKLPTDADFSEHGVKLAEYIFAQFEEYIPQLAGALIENNYALTRHEFDSRDKLGQRETAFERASKEFNLENVDAQTKKYAAKLFKDELDAHGGDYDKAKEAIGGTLARLAGPVKPERNVPKSQGVQAIPYGADDEDDDSAENDEFFASLVKTP